MASRREGGPRGTGLRLRSFMRVHRLDAWVRRRFSPAGRVVAGTALAAAVYAVNTRATLSYQLFCLAVALLAVALVGVAGYRGRFSARRVLPRLATVGVPLAYDLRLRNEGRGVQRGLAVEEVLQPGAPTPDEFARARDDAGRGLNWFDRRVGYPRWAALMRRRAGAEVRRAVVPDLHPGSEARVAMELVPGRRGYLRLAGLRVLRPDPLGLAHAERRVGGADRLLVLPRRYRVQWREWEGSSALRAGEGASQAASVGGDEEFAALREYRPGDPLRHIHWRGWARLGEPVVKEFHQHCLVRRGLVLDTALPEGAGAERFEEAVSVAASFAGCAPGGDGAVELLFVGAQAYRFSAGPGLGTNDHLLEALACAQVAGGAEVERLARAVLERAPSLSACVLVLLDWDAPRRRLAATLLEWGVALLVVVLSEDGAQPAAGPMAACPGRLVAVRVGSVAEGLAAIGGSAGAGPA